MSLEATPRADTRTQLSLNRDDDLVRYKVAEEKEEPLSDKTFESIIPQKNKKAIEVFVKEIESILKKFIDNYVFVSTIIQPEGSKKRRFVADPGRVTEDGITEIQVKTAAILAEYYSKEKVHVKMDITLLWARPKKPVA